MNKALRWVLILFFVFVGIGSIAYGGYRLYNYLIENATKRITQGVKKGVRSAINPLSW